MNARIDFETVFTRLRAGELAILPSARAARSLRQAFDADQRLNGMNAWEAPHVLSWSSWTASLWSDLILSGADTRLVLNAAQESNLWCDLIADLSPEDSLKQNLQSLAKLAQSGFALAAAWEVLPRLRTVAATHDQRTFALWAEEFRRRCEERKCVSSALVEGLLQEHLENRAKDALLAPSNLLLVNWPEFTPSQRHLLDAFARKNVPVETVATAPRSLARSTPLRVLAVAPDEREELLCAARWVRAQIEKENKRGGSMRIGVLLPAGPIPELGAVFREVLAPELQSIETDLSSAPWEFSAGELLAGVTLIAAALDLARLCTRPLALDAISSLLLSPYLGEAASGEPNARFDAHILRQSLRLRPEVTLRNLASMVAAAGRETTTTPAPWLPKLNDFAGKALDSKLRRSYSEWMEVVRRLTKIAGWPGARTLTALEFAAHRAWESVLDLVATLDFTGVRVPFLTALEAVERQTRETLLDAPSTEAPVTVLTAKEAVGCTFDALVLLRGTEEQWPPSRRPHPLLSVGLQREFGMPGTDPSREARLLGFLLDGSGKVLATCAEGNAEGALRPAPFFRQLSFEELSAVRFVPPTALPRQIPEELVPDDLPLPPLPSSQVRGGARVLQLQAACGFLAFAAIRLRSTELEARQAGFDARESGTLLHRALERFWKTVRSQAALRAMSFAERDALLGTCIDEAVPAKLSLETAWDEAYLSLQKQRLRTLLNQWMERELRRAPFTVAALEHEQPISVGPLDLRVRVDRLDRLDGAAELQSSDDSEPAQAGQAVVLVDYKSGYAADPKAWQGDRPDQPQLPLYALLHSPAEVKGVAFAHIRPGKMRYAGLETESGVLGGMRSGVSTNADVSVQMEQWRTALHALAEEFSQGNAEVNPKDFTQTCKHCAQRLLCRLDPAALQRPDPADDAYEGLAAEEVYG